MCVCKEGELRRFICLKQWLFSIISFFSYQFVLESRPKIMCLPQVSSSEETNTDKNGRTLDQSDLSRYRSKFQNGKEWFQKLFFVAKQNVAPPLAKIPKVGALTPLTLKFLKGVKNVGSFSLGFFQKKIWKIFFFEKNCFGSQCTPNCFSNEKIWIFFQKKNWPGSA